MSELPESDASPPVPQSGRLEEGSSEDPSRVLQVGEITEYVPCSESVPLESELLPSLTPSSAELELKMSVVDLSDPVSCCHFFLQVKDIIPSYVGRQRTRLNEILRFVSRCLSDYKTFRLNSHVRRMCNTLREETPVEWIIDSMPMDYTTYLFMEIYQILNSAHDPKFTIEKACSLVDSWNRMALDFCNLPNRQMFRLTLKLASLPQIIDNVKDLFSKSLFKRVFTDLIKRDKLKYDTQIVLGNAIDMPLPFNYICCPSGSGKTTFAMHMCCQESLAVYLLFSRALVNCPDTYATTQTAYAPFMSLSELFIHVLEKDCAVLSVSTQLKVDLATKRFAIIGFIVALVQELERQKSTRGNEDKTWLELIATCMSIEFEEMNGLKAQSILCEIQEKYPTAPLTFFIDEVKCESLEGFDAKRLMVIRSIFGCLGIVPVFLGTDTRSIDLFKITSKHSGVTPSDEVVANIFNCTPRYDAPRLLVSVEKIKSIHHDHPHIVAFVEFLCSSREFENPWLIRLALDYVKEHPYTCPEEYFDQLFSSLFKSFGLRKSYSIDFLEGQIRYLMFYAWSRLHNESDMLRVLAGRNLAPESCVNGHLGQLCGDPRYATTNPYFKLCASTAQTRCFVDLRSSEQQRTGPKTLPEVAFCPRSVFVPFHMAPLTGLTLFGLGPGHVPLKTDRGDARVYEAIMELKKQSMTSRSFDGSPLELMAYYSCVHASRARGVKGAPFPVFFERFIRSLMPGAYMVNVSRLVFDDLPLWNRHFIPFISPMGMGKWNAHIVKFLKALYDDDEIHLGIMGPSRGQDPVDCLVYNVNVDHFEESPEPVQVPTEHREYLQYESCIPEEIRSDDIALAIEYDQHVAPMKNAAIVKVLKDKFKKPQFKSCPIFILLALRFDKKINPDPQGFRMWRLCKVESTEDQYLSAVRPVFKLKEMKKSNANSQQMVILIDLETIFDNYPKSVIDELANIRI